MIPHPQQKRCFEIREDELIDIFAFLQDAPDFIQEIEGDIRKHICASHSSAQSEQDKKILSILKNLVKAFHEYEMDVICEEITAPPKHRRMIEEAETMIEELRSKQGEP